MNRREPEANITALVAKVADADAAMKAMNGVKAPTLLLWGGADPLLTVEAMDKLGSYLIQASVSKLVMPDVGHYPPMEVPQRYAKLVRAYVENATPVGDLKLRLSRQITGAITVAVIPKLQWKIQVDSDSDATNFGSHAGLQDQPQDRVEAARELDALLLSAPTTDDPAYQRGRSHEPDA